MAEGSAKVWRDKKTPLDGGDGEAPHNYFSGHVRCQKAAKGQRFRCSNQIDKA